MNTNYNDNDNDNIPIEINYNVIMDKNNSISVNSNETINFLDDAQIKIFHQPYEVSTIPIKNILNNYNNNDNIYSKLKICIILSMLCVIIVVCVIFI